MKVNVNSTATHEHIVADQAYERSAFGAWLDTAIPLDGAIISADPKIMQIIDDLLPEILNTLKSGKKLVSFKGKTSKTRIKYACKVILFNLYLAYQIGVPVRYSRRKAYYSSARRYGKLHFKYQRIIAIIDAFYKLGLIDCKIGKNSQTLKYRRQSRMWASVNLIQLFQEKSPHLLPVYRAQREECIELRRKDKTPINYLETDEVERLRTNVDSYNKFMSSQQVELDVGGSVTTNMNALKQLVGEALRGNVSIEYLTLDNRNCTNNPLGTLLYHDSGTIIKSTHDEDTTNSNTIHTILPGPYYPYTSSINTSISGTFFPQVREVYSSTADFHINQEVAVQPVEHPLQYLTTFVRREFVGQKYKRQQLRSEKTLADFSIDNIHCSIFDTALYRVFNESSFELGGRFYGATYQKLSEEWRAGLFINGEPTVEYDYSAHHIRIPYHLEGIDYQSDPYLALSDDPEERELMKKLLLIAVNADTEKKAIIGFRGEMHTKVKKGSGILTDKSIKAMLKKAFDVHKPIAKYIHSGAGKMLQYLDSQITEKILMRMTQAEIPCLPVHDSYIVPSKSQITLKQAMVEEYEQMLKYLPVIK